MIPLNPVLIQTIDLTAFFAPVALSIALATLVCIAVIAVLAYDGHRAERKGAPELVGRQNDLPIVLVEARAQSR
jgi:hypothetical protein